MTPVCYPGLAVYGLIVRWLDELEKAGIKEVGRINRFHIGALNQALERLLKAAQWRDDITWYDGHLPLSYYAKELGLDSDSSEKSGKEAK